MTSNSRFRVFILLVLISSLLLGCQPGPMAPQVRTHSSNTINPLGRNTPQKTRALLNQNRASRFKQIHKDRLISNHQENYVKYSRENLKQLTQKRKAKSFSIQSVSSPTLLVNEDFSTATSNFGNGTENGWLEWGGQYYRDPSGSNAVTVYNPQTQTSTFPTGFYKTIPLSASSGDAFVATINVATTFTSLGSDSTLVIEFNDPANTVVTTNTARGPSAKTQTLYAEALIPDGATQVTLGALAFLGQDETSSLLINSITFEQIPAGYYTYTTLIDEPLDAKGTTAYGTNSPTGVDEEFGYDFYVVDNWPSAYSGDGAVTIHNPSPGYYSASLGGISKKAILPPYQPGDALTARLYIAPTFNDTESNTSFALEFYDSNDQLLGTQTGDILYGNSYRWVIIDREPIPAGTTYAKVTPGTHLGPNETSSLLWDSMKLELVQVGTSGTGQETTVTIDSNGGTISLPGIGSLDIPAGALSQSTAITMSEILSSPSIDGFATVSPVVKFEPSGLTFSTPAILTLNTNTNLVGTNHPSLVQTLVNNGSNYEFLQEMGPPEQATLGRGVYVEHFSTFQQVIINKLQDHNLQEMCRTDKAFAAQSLTANWDSNSSISTIDLNNLCHNPSPANGGDGSFIVYYANSGTHQADSEQVLGTLIALEKSYQYYETIAGGNLPQEWFYEYLHPLSFLTKDIPVLMLPPDVALENPNLVGAGFTQGSITTNDENPLLAVDPKNSSLIHPKLEESVYHEVFHAFQATGATPTEYNNVTSSTASPSPAIALEITAAVMGARRLYEDWSSWSFTASGSTQSKEKGIWENSFYTEHITKNVSDFVNPIYSSTNPYELTTVMAGMLNGNNITQEESLSYSRQFIQQFNAPTNPIQDPFVALNSFFTGTDLFRNIYFPNYAAHSYLADRYGFDSANNGSDSLTQGINVFSLPLTPPSSIVSELGGQITAYTGQSNKHSFGTSHPVGLNHVIDSLNVRYYKVNIDQGSFNNLNNGVINVVLDTAVFSGDPSLEPDLTAILGKAARVIPVTAQGNYISSVGIKTFSLQGGKYKATISGWQVWAPESLIIVVPNTTFGDSTSDPSTRRIFGYDFSVYMTGENCSTYYPYTCYPIY